MGKMHDALKKAQHARPHDAEGAAQDGSATADRPTAAAMAGSFRSDLDPHLVCLTDPDGFHSNQYRILARNLRSVGETQAAGVVVMTSALPGEGKSLSAANLACALAENPESKVALVDADLMDPSMHVLFGLDNHRGVSDYLAGGTMLELVVQRCRLPNLWVLPAGHVPPDSTELLGGKRMDDLLVRLRRDYDHVVIDVPAVSTSPDAGVLGPRCDGAVLVVRMYSTAQDVAKSAIAHLQETETVVLGLVLTGLEAATAA